ALGTLAAPPDCDWARDDAGITEFIRLSFFDSVWCRSIQEEHEPNSLLWYPLVPHINLDAAAYRWLQNKFSWSRSPLCRGTIGYHWFLQWYCTVPGVVKEGMMARPSMPKHRQEGGGTAVRERILEAAFAAFMKSGYAAASTLEIATRARVSKRELYAFVGDKQEMLIACISRRARRIDVGAGLPALRARETLARGR